MRVKFFLQARESAIYCNIGQKQKEKRKQDVQRSITKSPIMLPN